MMTQGHAWGALAGEERRNVVIFRRTMKFQLVQITTDFVTPPISRFLSVVGGSMGLWLGLGVLQVMEMIVSLVLPAP
jgi:hypothetical protein